VISFAMMLGSHLMTFDGVLVLFGRFVVRVLGHVYLPDRVATFSKRRSGVIVPISIRELPLRFLRLHRAF
jgi:hypothetical protein